MTISPSAIRLTRWMAAIGLAGGVLYAFGGLIYDLATTGLNEGTAMAFLALIVMPLSFGAIGFVLGAVVGAFRGVEEDERTDPE